LVIISSYPSLVHSVTCRQHSDVAHHSSAPHYITFCRHTDNLTKTDGFATNYLQTHSCSVLDNICSAMHSASQQCSD